MVERDSTAFEKLTPREREILRLIAGHLQSKEIARALGLSPKTVEMHVLSARRRLSGLSRRDAALAFVAWEGDPGNDYRKRPGGMATLTDTPLAGRKIGTRHDAITQPDTAARRSSSGTGEWRSILKALVSSEEDGRARPPGRDWRDEMSNLQWVGLVLGLTVLIAGALTIAALILHRLMLTMAQITGH